MGEKLQTSAARRRCSEGPARGRPEPRGEGGSEQPSGPGTPGPADPPSARVQPHPPGFQQQRGLGPLGGQVSRHRLGRGGRPGAEQREPQQRVAQEQRRRFGRLPHDAERDVRAARTRSGKPAAATRRPAPPGAPPPTSGGGSSRPLLRPGLAGAGRMRGRVSRAGCLGGTRDT